jgi:prepilin-type N-terminal cleavage/methylation domain-containing protein
VKTRAFTLVELLTVIAIISILAGLVLMTTGYVQKKSAASRAEAEIQAMSSACESYKADNGIYPRNSDTDALNSTTQYDPNSYKVASLYLYGQLSGDYNPANPGASTNFNLKPDTGEGKSYMEFKQGMLGGTKDSSGKITRVTHLQDPFGYSYGYSTIFQANSENPAPADPSPGFNPTFDLWSTGGTTNANASANKAKWIKNW